jgi:signal transduction histidine kinase
MFKTLYGKLVAVLLGFGLMMAVTFIPVVRYSHESYHDEISQKLNLGLAAKLVKEKQTLVQGQQFNHAALQDILDRLALINPQIGLYLLDESGRVIASSGAEGALARPMVDLGPVRQVLDGSAEIPVRGDDPADASRRQVFSVAPVGFDGHPRGYLYVVLRGDEHDGGAQQLKKSYAMRESMWVVGVGIVLSLVASLVLLSVVTRPLRRLTKLMDRFRQRGFSEQPEDGLISRALGEDDIDRLAVTFNEMTHQMLRQMQELKQTDQTRREMIANISHDLRTPLAALQGYLETLHLKQATLTEQERKEYFAIALKQSAQLSKLVGKLFELAKLDADNAEFFPELFPLDDLVQDVVEQFSLAASNKELALEADLPESPLLVRADIGLIERVLENLIDNAIRYTPAGGKVKVSLSPFRGEPWWRWPIRALVSTPRISHESLTVSTGERRAGPPRRAPVWGWPSPGASSSCTAAASRCEAVPAPVRSFGSACRWDRRDQCRPAMPRQRLAPARRCDPRWPDRSPPANAPIHLNVASVIVLRRN